MDDGYWRISLSSVPGLWSPGRVEDANGVVYDERYFGRGERLDLSHPLRLPEYPFGQRRREVTPPLLVSIALDGRFDGIRFMSGGTLVVPTDIAGMIEELAGSGVQRIPLQVRGKDAVCEILNVTERLDCIDYAQSHVDWWTADSAPPHLIGRLRYVSRLIINPKAAIDRHIFRPVGLETAVIVSSTLMNALRSVHAVGIDSVKVS